MDPSSLLPMTINKLKDQGSKRENRDRSCKETSQFLVTHPRSNDYLRLVPLSWTHPRSDRRKPSIWKFTEQVTKEISPARHVCTLPRFLFASVSAVKWLENKEFNGKQIDSPPGNGNTKEQSTCFFFSLSLSLISCSSLVTRSSSSFFPLFVFNHTPLPLRLFSHLSLSLSCNSRFIPFWGWISLSSRQISGKLISFQKSVG